MRETETLALIEKEAIEKERKKKDMLSTIVKEYQEESNRLAEIFKQDVFKDLGIEDNPKREKLLEIAYREGHSGGFSEIYSQMIDLVELNR